MSEGSDNNGGLDFIVGALVVVVGIGAYVLFGHTGGSGTASSTGGSSSKTTIERTTVAPTPGGDGVSITNKQTERTN